MAGSVSTNSSSDVQNVSTSNSPTSNPAGAVQIKAQPSDAQSNTSQGPDGAKHNDTAKIDQPSASAQPQPTLNPQTSTPTNVMGGLAPSAPSTPASPSSSSAAPQAPTRTDIPLDSSVTDQLKTALVAGAQRGDGSYTLSLQLHPAELGLVHVDMHVQDGVVNLQMRADGNTAALLRSNLDQLRTQLTGSGLTAGNFGVGTGQTNSQGFGAWNQSNANQSSFGQNGGHDGTSRWQASEIETQVVRQLQDTTGEIDGPLDLHL